ncbi:hypothetical protein PENTCL1PPCAC_1288, partial [Pristionchus entomophagus]
AVSCSLRVSCSSLGRTAHDAHDDHENDHDEEETSDDADPHQSAGDVGGTDALPIDLQLHRDRALAVAREQSLRRSSVVHLTHEHVPSILVHDDIGVLLGAGKE